MYADECSRSPAALESLFLWQTPLVRFAGDPRLPLRLPSLRRLDLYTSKNNADRLLLTPATLPSLRSFSVDLDTYPLGPLHDSLLIQLHHVSTADCAPDGAAFPSAVVYDCWETAYSISPPLTFGIWAPLPAGLRCLRLRSDPHRGGEAYDPARATRRLLEHFASGTPRTRLEELRVPRGWETGKQADRLRERCKADGTRLVFEDLPAVRWGQDWWADDAFWALVDAA